MKKSVMVTEISPEDFEVMLKETIRKVLSEQSQVKSVVEDQLMSDKELEKLLGVSRATLYLWRRDGKILYQRIGKKIFYKVSEVEKAMGLIRDKSNISERRRNRRRERQL